MTQPISTTQLEQLRQSIETGGVDAAEQAYSDLYAMGYNYAGWAGGVATGELLSGQAALSFLESTAQESGLDLTPAQIDQIRVDMALRTLDEYISVAQENGGELVTDLNFEQVNNVHDDVFQANGLSLDNWTLNTPMELVR